MLRRFVLVVVVVLAAACPRSREAPHDPPRNPAPGASTAAAPLTCRTLEGCTDACSDAACAEACVRRLTAAARPAYDALQACVKPACAAADAGAAPCQVPGSFGCKMCVLARCAAQAASCLKN